jgi:hypothetical protein
VIRLLAVLVIALAVTVPGAFATESTIYPGKGIGKVKLGMTLKQVTKVLGAPQTVNRRAQLSLERGYIEYGWSFTTTWVGFVNRKGVLHAELVGTDLAQQRTPGGIGVGSTPATLTRKLPVTSCTQAVDGTYRRGADAYGRILAYCLFASNRPVTVFTLYCTERHKPSCPGFRVGEVVVRSASLPVKD